jgi:hypothetical protein
VPPLDVGEQPAQPTGRAPAHRSTNNASATNS